MPGPGGHLLTGHQLRTIYEKDVLPHLVGPASERPTALFVAGQPGAGKTTMQQDAIRRLGLEDAYFLDGDDLLDLHPYYQRLSRENDVTAAGLCRPDIREWRDQAITQLIDGRRDLILAHPMGEHELATEWMGRLREDYQVVMAVAAVHEAQSELGAMDRFVTGRQQVGFGREAAPEVNHRFALGLLDTAYVVQQDKLADQIDVYRRGPEIVSHHELVDGRWAEELPAAESIQNEWNKPWTDAQAEWFVRTRGELPSGLHPEWDSRLERLDGMAEPKLAEYRRATGLRPLPTQQASRLASRPGPPGWLQAQAPLAGQQAASAVAADPELARLARLTGVGGPAASPLKQQGAVQEAADQETSAQGGRQAGKRDNTVER